jgi:hypothetical protein
MADSTEPTSVPRSRRAVLVGALTGLGISIGQAVIRPLAARAAGNDGTALAIGGFYADARSQTTLANQANDERVLWVASNADIGHGNGVAVTGFSSHGTGVEGWTDSGTGVYGHGGSYGVHGESSNSYGIYGHSTDFIGIYGSSDTGKGLQGSGGNTGVYASGGVAGVYANSSAGKAVQAETSSGTAVEALGGTGIALHASGRVKVDKASGRATITAGHTSVTVIPGLNITSTSFVLLTPMSNIGTRSLWVTIDASANTFQINITTSRSASTKVGWLLLG